MTAIGTAPASGVPAAQSMSGQSRKVRPAFDMEAFKRTLEDRYRAWTELPAEERIRDKYLNDHKLSESSLANLPPEERLLHEERIAKQTKQPMLKSYEQEDLEKAKNSTSLLSERTLVDIMTLKLREAEFSAREAANPSNPAIDPQES
ncbi:hypothetical protein [Roseibium litorale]|uniref:Uncharacterized protein n=1 Tax=Roseibium litorale TaxID=2803841 RepID=A0ABR9CRK2_9HYPH|nr:hypothetical protein [Roseibium litorale]MBD8893418.1 hypothetical protein [Roseibium litorale]